MDDLTQAPPPAWTQGDFFIPSKDVRRRLGNISKMTLFRWRKRERFPEPFYITPQKPLWRLSEILAWVERHPTKAPEELPRLREGKERKKVKNATKQGKADADE